jgi:hypothetical protein
MRNGDLLALGEFNIPADGMLYTNDTCVGVRRPWISYPATVVLATIILLVGVLLQTEIFSYGGDVARDWKGSFLPYIHHPIDLFSHSRTPSDRERARLIVRT